MLKRNFNQPSEHAICMSVNQEFLEIFKQALVSIFKNYPEHPDVHVLVDDDMSMEDMPYKDIISYHHNDVEDKFIKSSLYDIPLHKMKSFYARYQIRFSDIFDTYENVLYLDADTIITDSLHDLMNNENFFMCAESNLKENGYIKDMYIPEITDDLQQDNLADKIANEDS